MDNKKNDISAEDLLKQLKANLELNSIEPKIDDIPPPKEEVPEVKVQDVKRNNVYKFRRSRREDSVIVEDTPSGKKDTGDVTEAENASEPVKEEPDLTKEVKAEAPTGETDDTLADKTKVSTREFEAVKKDTVEDITVIETNEVKGSTDPVKDDIDPDTLMKKYLSESEYNEVLNTREVEENDELTQHISEAEEYINSIENLKKNGEPQEPKTETEKVLKDIASSDTEFDETDVNLMIAFGMEEELAEKLGADKIKDVNNALDIDAEAFEAGHKAPSEIDQDLEFISSNQIKEVFAVYKNKHRKILLRFFGAVIFLVFTFFFENAPALGITMPSWFNPQMFPLVYSMVGLQILFVGVALVYRQVWDGFIALIKFKPISESLLFVLTFLATVYHIVVCFAYDGSSKIVLCNFPIAICITLAVISDLMNLKREIFSFNIISSKRVKYAITSLDEENSALEHKTFSDYIDDDSTIFRINKTSFIDGFFRRTREYSKSKQVLKVIIPMSVFIALFFFAYTALLKHDLYSGITAAYVSLILSMPFSVFLTFSYPFYRASKLAFDMGSTIVGDSSLEEYSNAVAVSFDDRDVFLPGSTKVKSIKVYGNNRIDKVLFNLASLFNVLGGPISDVFNIATKDLGCSEDVELMDISGDGIEAVVDGRHIFYGRASYLKKNNFLPIVDIDDEDIEHSGEACISYLVCNDEVASKIYIQYAIDQDFLTISKQLYRAGMCIGIKTFDPGIDNRLLGKFVNLAKYPVKILKCRSLSDKTIVEERSDSGIVSKKNAKSLLKTLSLCDKVNHATKANLLIKALSLLVSFVIMAFIMFKGNPENFSGFYVALYQLFWIIPTSIFSKLSINK